MNRAHIDDAAHRLGELARRDVPLGPFTTYRVGGPASLFVTAHNEGHLEAVRQVVRDTGIDTLVIGRGSNLLIADRGFSGLAITLAGEFGEITTTENLVRAGAAVTLPVLARKTASIGLRGLEWAVGVPGSVGGAIRMNAGGHGSQTVEHLRRCRFVDLVGDQGGTVLADALQMGYRHSALAPHHVVVWGEFELASGSIDEANARISEIVKWRREHQPGGHNAGSVFTNPMGDSAGRLIDESGLRGFRIGTASVSEKHANFIQSDTGGTSSDIVAVMHSVQETVAERTGVTLHSEVRLIGFTESELEGLR